MAYRYLWTPLALGPVTVRNRIVFSAHLTNYARGRPADRAARRLLRGPGRRRRRADHHRGALDPSDRLALREADPRLPPRRDPRLPARSPTPCTATACRSSPRSTTTAARRARCTRGCRCGRRRRSPTRCSARCPRRSTHAEIAEIVAGYARVAEHCAEGGFDGIELQCSHSSIVRGFLSPATNRRTDDYGGIARQPGPAAARDRRRRARGDRRRPGARRAALRRRADRGRHDDRRRGRGRPDGRGNGPGRLHQHLDRRRHGERCS